MKIVQKLKIEKIYDFLCYNMKTSKDLVTNLRVTQNSESLGECKRKH